MTSGLHRLFVTLWIVALASVPLSVRWTLASGGTVLAVPLEILVAVCAGMLAVMWLLGQGLDRRLFLHPVSLVVLCGLAWILLTSITSVQPQVSVKYALARMAYTVTFFWGGLWIFSRAGVRSGRIAAFGLIGFLPVVGWTVVRHARSGFSFSDSIEIGAPFYSNHLEYGATLAFWLLLLCGLALARKARAGLLVSGVFLGMLPLMWAAHSRSAWLATAAGFGVIILGRLGVATWRILSLGVLVLVLFFGAFAVYFYCGSPGGWGVGTEGVPESGFLQEASIRERLNRWSCSVRMAEMRPWVGFGPGTYEASYGYFQDHRETTSHSSLTGGRGDAHSEFFSALAEQGIVGFVLVATLFWLAIDAGLRAARTRGNGPQQWVALGWTGSIMTLAIGSLFNSYFEVDRMAPLLWMACAAVVFMDRDRATTNPGTR